MADCKTLLQCSGKSDHRTAMLFRELCHAYRGFPHRSLFVHPALSGKNKIRVRHLAFQPGLFRYNPDSRLEPRT